MRNDKVQVYMDKRYAGDSSECFLDFRYERSCLVVKHTLKTWVWGKVQATSSELFYPRNNEHLLILLWSLGSTVQTLLLLIFIVSKWRAIPSRKKGTYTIGFINVSSVPCVVGCVSL